MGRHDGQWSLQIGSGHGEPFPYLHDPQNSNSLRGNKIASIYRYLSGVLWIAYENGDQLGYLCLIPTRIPSHITPMTLKTRLA